jgi:hypothetical protein
VLPGTLITLRRRCGKASCHCASGTPHETPALSYSLDGHSKMLTLRPEEVKPVAQAVARYKSAMGTLEAEAYEDLATLVAAIQARRAVRR